MSGSRKKKLVISVDEKLKALKRLDDGETTEKIASSLKVAQSTVRMWKKNRSDIEKWCLSRPGKYGF